MPLEQARRKDSGVSWDQDFTLNERESERPIMKVPDKQGREPNHEGEKHPIEGGNSPIFYSLTRKKRFMKFLLPLGRIERTYSLTQSVVH